MSGGFPIYAVAGAVLLLGGLFALLFAFDRTSTWFGQLPTRRKISLFGPPAVVVVASAGLVAVFLRADELPKENPAQRTSETIALDGWAQAFLARADDKRSGGSGPSAAAGRGAETPLEAGSAGGGRGGNGGSGAPGGGPAPTVGSNPEGSGDSSGNGDGDSGPGASPEASSRPEGSSREAPDTETNLAIRSTAPKDGDTDVRRGTNVSVTFNAAMNRRTTERAFSLAPSGDPGAKVTGEFDWEGNKMTFAPKGNLAADTKYTAKVGKGAEDFAGNALDSEPWTFTTGTLP